MEATTANTDVVSTALKQIGGWNLMAVSGGRVTKVNDTEFDLPVSNGYHVRVYYDDVTDTYHVERLFMRGINAWVKAEWSMVHAEELGEIVYRASLFNN